MLGDFEVIFSRLDVVRSGCLVDFQTCCWVTFSSASPVHPSFAKNTILLNPETFSCLDYKWVWTSDLLKGEEVEVGHLVPWQVEVVANCSVEVVSGRPPVLSAPHSTCPCCPNLVPKKEDKYKTEATTGELGTKNNDVKFFLLTLIGSPPIERIYEM